MEEKRQDWVQVQAGKFFYQKVSDALEMMAAGYADVLFYSSLCGQFGVFPR